MSTIGEIGISTVAKRTSKTYLKAFAIISVIVAGFLFPLGYWASGVHNDNLFELDGNIAGNGIVADGPDWADLFNSTGGLIPGVLTTFGGTAATFLPDDISTASAVDRTTYSGAGTSNKNNDPISQADCTARGLTGSACNPWHWDSGNVPSKDDFERGYVYATTNASNSHLIIYSGFERRVASGDSHIDIEFIQSLVGLDKSVPCGTDLSSGPTDGAPCEFTGLRTVNDTIVSMDFTTGGKLGTVSVRRWNGVDYCNPAGASGCPALETLNAAIGQFCTTDDFICGLNNGSPLTAPAAPWEPGAIDTNEFTEFGVDISGLLGTSPCFSNVEGKTRSSQSFTAELKDFAGPFGFDVCKLSVKKTVTPKISKIGDSLTYNYTIRNDGAITLFKKSIIDSRFGSLTGNCGASLLPGSSCSFLLVHVVNASDPDPLVNVVTVTYNNKADFTGTDLVRTDTQTVDLVHPSFTISKDCNPKKVAPTQTVTYTIVVNNTSPDVGLVPFSVVDSLLGNITSSFNSLSAGASQTVTKTRQVLATDPHLLNNTVTATYTLDPSTKLPNKITHSASCTVEVLRPVVKVTGFGYTNTPSQPIPDRSGIVSGVATFTVKVMNFGPATAVLNGNVTASVTKTSGSFSCTGGLKKDITGSVIQNGSAEFSLVCTYADLNDGAKVQADLLLDYTVEGTGGPTFQASGSPASVSFTTQSD